MNKKEILTEVTNVANQMKEYPWRITVLRHMGAIGMAPTQRLELRVINTEEQPVVKQVQDAASMFLSAFHIYPTSIAVHPALASLLEASETVITAKHRLVESCPEMYPQIFGAGFEVWPLRVERDNSLDLKTVAVRFGIDLEDPAYQEAFHALLMEMIEERKK